MKISNKWEDSGSVQFYVIEDIIFKKVLIDLRASLSLMPFLIYKNLGIGKFGDTRMNLNFADHSTKHPSEITKVVLVKIDKFSFLVYFVIMGTLEDEKIPHFLCRSFLLTGQCNIDLEKGTHTLKVYDEKIILNMLEIRKQEEYKENRYQVALQQTRP